MELLARLLTAIGIFSFLVFVVLFGRVPTFRKTPIAWLHRILTSSIPNHLRNLDDRLTNGRVLHHLSRLANYLFHTRNPIILIIFLVIVYGAAAMFLAATYDQFTLIQWLPVPVILPAPLIFTLLCAKSTSIFITPANHPTRMSDYPFDYALYHPARVCTTCNLIKPPRSKHCSLCGHCVARADHHCVWVNTCVARQNYRWFLAVLLSVAVLETYATWLGFNFLRDDLDFASLSRYSFFSKIYWNRLSYNLMYATQKGGLSIAGVTLLAGTTTLLPLGLLAYHIYLIWAGTTTNENNKWSYLQEDMADGLVWKAKRSEVLAYKRTLRDAKGNPIKVDDEAYVPWPISTDQIILTTTDGRAPRGLEHLYAQVWSLGAVENLYDLGFWENLKQVLRGE